MDWRGIPTLSKKQEHEYRQALVRLDKYSRMTDSQFTVPLTGIRFGVDPILGLLPVVGDFIGLLLALPVLTEAARIGAPAALRRKMIRNIIIDAVFGLVPIFGDIFDVYWKANTRNTMLLRNWIRTQVVPEKAVPSKDRMLIVLMAVLLVGVTAWLFL